MTPTSAPAPVEAREGERIEAGFWLRARVFLSRLRLDRELAGGAAPSARPELALRAQQLQLPRVRERLAKAIYRLIEEAVGEPRPRLGPAGLPVDERRVRANLLRFAELARELRGPGPHGVRGLAMASTLLEDGSGPLYAVDPPPGELREALDATISGLKGEHA